MGVSICSQSFKLDYFGKSDNPTGMYPLSWSAAINMSLPKERGFPSLGSHSCSWVEPTAAGSSWLGFLHFLIYSTLLHVLLSRQIFIWPMTKNRLQVQYESITQQSISVKLSFHQANISDCDPCIITRMTESNGEQHEMIYLDKLQEASVQGNRKRFLLHAFKHFS